MSEQYTTENEIWRPIPSLEGFYEASNLGRIRSVSRWVKRSLGGFQRLNGRVLKLVDNAHASMVFAACVRGVQKTISAHAAVCEAFNGPRPTGYDCCHYDGNYRNNCPENLRWDTRQGNVDDSIRHGTHAKGEINGQAKITESDVQEFFSMRKSGMRYRDIAKAKGVKLNVVVGVLNGHTWKHVKVADRTKIPQAHPKGEENFKAKLVAADIAEIFQMHRSGIPQYKIGECKGVSKHCIYCILTRKTWKHISIPTELVSH